ncbi:MAG: class I SAM-dependent methyltransferase [Acidobacteria bacterium]|nr:class I SAM-dependent methyltransferase [Acidobacteriota bacterium]
MMTSALERLLPCLTCVVCGESRWSPSGTPVDALACGNCGTRHAVRDGVLYMAAAQQDGAVVSERAAVAETEHIARLGGINDEFDNLATATGALKDAILALPYGNGSRYYQEPGYFSNVAACAPAFDYIVSNLGCTSGGRILDIGADLTWSTSQLAKRGFEAVAIDINHHLPVASIFEESGPCYARVNADMHARAFGDASFDGVTAFNALHHTGRLQLLADNIARVLKPGGRLGFVEPYCLDAARKLDFGADQSACGINEHVYLLEEWHLAFVSAGLELVTFLLADSFNAIYRKPAGGRPPAFISLSQAREALFADYYDAVLSVEPLLDQSAEPADRLKVPVRVRNRGRASWSSVGAMPVYLSYHLSRVEQSNVILVTYDNPRVSFPAFFGPGQSTVLSLDIQVPADTGDYLAEIDLVHEGQTWFVQRGVRPETVRFATPSRRKTCSSG